MRPEWPDHTEAGVQSVSRREKMGHMTAEGAGGNQTATLVRTSAWDGTEQLLSLIQGTQVQVLVPFSYVAVERL